MKVKINVSVEEGVVEEVDAFASKFALSRSQAVQNLLCASLADEKTLRSLGLMDLALMVKKVKERLILKTG